MIWLKREGKKKKSDSNLILGKKRIINGYYYEQMMYVPKQNICSNKNTFKISYWNTKENAGL